MLPGLMGRLYFTLGAALAVGAAMFFLQPSAGAQSAPSRIVDRAFLCSVPLQAGLRQIEVSAVSGFRDPDNRRRWRHNAAAAVGKLGVGDAWVSAGDLPGGARDRALGIDAQNCRSTTARAPFSTKGLVGGVASQLQGGQHVGSDAYECQASSRVVIRIRALFRAPTRLEVQRRFGRRILTTVTAVVAREAQLAVRTQTGKPIAYASATESGKARLFTAPSCLPD
jgi:hypothetical protein